MAAIASSSAASSSTALSSDPGVEHLRGVAKALGYPSWEVLDFRAEGARQSRPSREARRFVAFCEHRKIRALPVSERDVCDCDGDAGAWLATFEAYLEKIGCPSFEDSVASRRRQQLCVQPERARQPILLAERRDVVPPRLRGLVAAARKEMPTKASGKPTAKPPLPATELDAG